MRRLLRREVDPDQWFDGPGPYAGAFCHAGHPVGEARYHLVPVRLKDGIWTRDDTSPTSIIACSDHDVVNQPTVSTKEEGS